MALRDDDFIVNDIFFSIPPTGISFISHGNIYTYETMKMGTSGIIRPGTGNLSMQVSFIIAGPRQETGETVAFHFNNSLLPLYRWVQTYPFVVIKNEFVASVVGSKQSLWVFRVMKVNLGPPLPPKTVGVDLMFEFTPHRAYGQELAWKIPFGGKDKEAWQEVAGKEVSAIDYGVLRADGKEVLNDTSIGTFLYRHPETDLTTEIGDSAPYQVYKHQLTHDMRQLNDYPSQEIKLGTKLLIPKVLPPELWPKEKGKPTPIRYDLTVSAEEGDMSPDLDMSSRSSVRLTSSYEAVATSRAQFIDKLKIEATKARVPWEILDAVITAESGYQEEAVSNSGTVGLFQLNWSSWHTHFDSVTIGTYRDFTSEGLPYFKTNYVPGSGRAVSQNLLNWKEYAKQNGDQRFNGNKQLEIMPKLIRDKIVAKRGNIVAGLHDWEPSRSKWQPMFFNKLNGKANLRDYGLMD